MGLITEEVEVNIVGGVIKYYESLGYEIPRQINKSGKLKFIIGSIIKVKVEDLQYGSNAYVDIKCDCCGKELKIKWQNYKKQVKDDGKYYCQKCAIKLYGIENRRQIRLKNGNTFENWCIKNNKQDILTRWDFELNNCLPSEICHGTNEKYYFKCIKNLHYSELKSVNDFTNGRGSMDCKQCNSFAQYLLDNFGENALEKYWDWDKNNELGINPWEISKAINKPKVWIKCQSQEKNYHGSYDVGCSDFIKGCRCPYCSNRNGKVHPLDSLGKLLEDKGLLHLWSDKNKRLPYEYSPMSNQEVYWKCPENIHEDYFRNISNSNICDFRCPECQYSQGEERISNYLINKDFIKISEDDYKILDNVFKEKNNYYIPQKKFDSLVGMGNGLLSYDFYLPNFNLLIEYQGMQHEKYCKGFHKSKKDFEKQVEHDRRKYVFAQDNNINLLEIWYYDYDNIEKILDDHLNNNLELIKKYNC